MLKEKVYLEPEQVEVTAVLEYYSDAEIKRFFNYSGPGSGMPKTYEEVLSALETCVKETEVAVSATLEWTGHMQTVSIRFDEHIVFRMPEDGTPKLLRCTLMDDGLPLLVPFRVHTVKDHVEKGEVVKHYVEGKSILASKVKQ